MTPDLVFDAQAQLGEGPVWDDRRARLLFVDIMRGHVHAFDPVGKTDRILDVGEPVGAVAPTTRGDWIVATQTGFSRLDPETGTRSPIAPVEADQPETRMNDGCVDRRGRFWAGTMGMGGVRERGALYRLDPDGSVTRVLTGVSISNGIDWSPDDRLMYYVDTPTGRVDCFDFDADDGAIRNRRAWVDVPTKLGWPDGLVVDADGSVWLALWEGGAVHRYAPDGRLELVVRFPVTLTTKPAFGGPDLDDMYITSAWIELDEHARAREPMAGGLFRIQSGARGPRPRRFAG
ncbi:MAG TPA: SMP-30/gluconolactonase/LRE family protein [Vicinamibacterales bacterium]|nr:SMP-30/gluconolactonase/LRE family protein [Vicinamibacterales bacterium]